MVPFLGDCRKASLNGDCGGRRAGLWSTVERTVFMGEDGTVAVLKSNLEATPSNLRRVLGGGFTGDRLRALVGVLSLQSSSSEPIELDFATWFAFLGDKGRTLSPLEPVLGSVFGTAAFRPRVLILVVAGLRIGLALSPVALGADLSASMGTFSLSFSASSWNLTFFLGAAVIFGITDVVEGFVVATIPRVRAVFLAVSGFSSDFAIGATSTSESWILLALVRSFGTSAFTVSATLALG